MKYDVVIAGGGPVGLFLACELGLAGVNVLLLERKEDPRSPLKAGWSGMRGLNIPSVEALHRRGLLDAVKATALAWLDDVGKPSATGSAPSRPRFAGHFAGIMLDANKIDLSARKYLTPGPAATGGLISLEAFELVLALHAQKLGVDLRLGMPVSKFDQSEEGVSVEAGGETFHTQWLIGCDGGRSTVRKLAGFEFTGTDPEFTGYTAHVDIADPEKLQPGFHLTAHGMYISGPGPGRIGMIDFDDTQFDRTQHITLERLQTILRRISGTDVILTALHVASSYTDRARQATTYRKDRVLLAGDAAHIHSPLGGQGLNTGLGDAMNLGWKLAATIKGHAAEGLLDTYTTERHPIGAWALEWTRAQVAIMRPDPHARAIANVVRDLINTREGTSYFVEKISGISQRYDLPGEHPLVGRSAPDLQFKDGKHLGELLRDGTGVLLDLSGNPELATVAAKYGAQLKYRTAEASDSKGLSALLVRPDGYVAWAADSDPNFIGLEAAAKRWLTNSV